jgi:hypothetical protein
VVTLVTVELTRASGGPVSVVPGQVCLFTSAGSDQSGSGTELLFSNGKQEVVRETYEAVKATLGDSFVELTEPNGDRASVAPDQVCFFFPAGKDQKKGSRAVLYFSGGQQQAVRETYEQVKAALR